MRRIRVPRELNTRDYIRRGYCDQCRQDELSIVIHHPPKGRPFTICNRCSESTWVAVGQTNINNWLTTGRVTDYVPRSRQNNTRGKSEGHRSRPEGQRQNRRDRSDKN